MDPLARKVIYAAETGHLPRGRGLDDESREFTHLLYGFMRARRAHELELQAKMHGAR